MPTVSIVIPAYNHAPYLAQTISSALAQTWRDFEVIVVDDGSTDETAKVAAQFGDAIRYIRQDNRGIAGARNTGIRHAYGEFVSLLDDDDLWERDYLEIVLSVFRKYPDTAAVHAGWQAIDKEGKRSPQRSVRAVPPERLYHTLMAERFFSGACVTVRKTVLDNVGLFDETLQGCDDLDMWLRISRAHTFRGIPRALVLYRVHEGGLSSDGLHMFGDLLMVISKHIGPEEGDPQTWSNEKRRAYGFTYRWGARECIQQGQSDEGYRLLAQAVDIYPCLLDRLDTFYELVLGDQPRGYRGQADLLDIEGNGAEMLKRLDGLFAKAGPALEPLCRIAYGNAYLALGMLSDQAGGWATARRYLVEAVKTNPSLLGSYPVIRRLFKLCAGQRLVTIGRRLRREVGT
jgi:tetratricopeptide (TPR) repeat protein